MEIIDNTLNIKFAVVKVGMCFTYCSQYYMKVKLTEFDDFTNTDIIKIFGLNLESGELIKFELETKVRLLKTTLTID